MVEETIKTIKETESEAERILKKLTRNVLLFWKMPEMRLIV